MTRYRALVSTVVSFCITALAGCSGDMVAPPNSETNQLSVQTSLEPGSPSHQPKVSTEQTDVRYLLNIGDPVPPSVIVSYQGLEWVWASPCALNGCTGGIAIGKDGFNFATPAQWALFPPVAMFTDKCASPWFDRSFDHCDGFDLFFLGTYGSVATGGTGQLGPRQTTMSGLAETFLVRPAAPLDVTPPEISPTVTGPLGDNDWYVSDVSVAWDIVDAESAAAAGSGCNPITIAANTAGTTLTCGATSAGGSASASVTIKRDATPPTVTYSGNAGSYTVDQMVAITCAANDELSGVASSTCADVSGAAYTFALGANILSATAKDLAGNAGGGQTSFTVSVTFQSVCNLATTFASHEGIAISLCSKLRAASVSEIKGNERAEENQLGAFINEVQAQSGKAIGSADADVLVQLANALKAQIGT